MRIPRSLLLCTALAGGCGSPQYLLWGRNYERARAMPASARTPVPAIAVTTTAHVHVERRRLLLRQARPAGEHVRVPISRPVGFFIAGTLLLGSGLAITAGGLDSLLRPCPPGYLCEDYLTAPLLLSFGAAHSLIGGILLMVGGSRWSPEVSGPRP
jgi:hypothetical protein